MSNVTTVGIDLAKSVFSLHGWMRAGAVVLRRTRAARRSCCELVAQFPPCLIGMEACSGRTSGRVGSRGSGTRCG